MSPVLVTKIRRRQRLRQLLAKVICHSATGFEDATQRCYRALCEFFIVGCDTNIALLQNILCHPAFQAADLHTGFLLDNQTDLLSPTPSTAHAQLHFDEASAKHAADEGTGRGGYSKKAFAHELAGSGAIVTALTGTVVSLQAEVGDTLAVGQSLCVLSAMKMESTVTAQRCGKLLTWLVTAGSTVAAGDVIATFEPDGSQENVPTQQDVATEQAGEVSCQF